jgi:peptidoglycan/xylan/chitin deacetylase (PgdA/CDA1 family)
MNCKTHYLIKLLSPFYIGFVLISLGGCTGKQPIKIEAPIDFKFVTALEGDSFESLAKEHTGSENLAWRIQEFNNSQSIAPGQQLIIPLKPYNFGGLNAKGHQLIPVLSYHNFSKGRSHNKITVSAKNFRAQLSYLKENNYHAISMSQFIEFLNFGHVPKKSVLITIDDGRKSSYEIAYPILKEFGFGATLFIPTHSIRPQNKNAITWAQINEMVTDQTIDIQCHAKPRRNLTKPAKNESFTDYLHAIDKELLNSTQIIQQHIGKRPIALAYPFGKTNPLVMALVEKHGYKAGFTVKRKNTPFYQQSFLLNRTMVYGTFSLKRFIKNLRYFAENKIAQAEPIDSLLSLATLTEISPDIYEQKQQWRTALLAWKLQRDKLLSQQPPASSTAAENLQQTKQKIADLSSKLGIIANTHYQDARYQLNAGSIKIAKKALLQTLLFNPKHQEALALLQSNLGKFKNINYTVKENDSFKSIAIQVYQAPNKAPLIPLFNDNINNEQDLISGTQVSLPSLPKRSKTKKTVIIKKRCNVKLTKSSKALATDYYHKANNSFNHDQMPKAISHLKTAICLNPAHTEAKEMLEMLQAL